MADSFLGKLAVATAGAALSLAVMGAQPAGAATITYDFSVGVTSGPLTGNQYSGFFRYDDATTSRAGELILPYFEISDFYFDFVNTSFQNAFQSKTYTRRDLFIDLRAFPYSLPLYISGGEIIQDPSGDIDLIPRGGHFNSFGFSTFNRFDRGEAGWWHLATYGGFNYKFGWDYSSGPDPGLSGSGTVTYWLRETPTSRVPEPGTAFGLGVLGAGWLLRKKRASRSLQGAAGNGPKSCASAPSRNRQREGTAP
ncbi:PEP-CTERM sorting domain-containing protein [Kamptonema formosum]|uniref:PEP-CTERM sorting domain-containing protein n=1 Tax=Kamptonema formosum TaxID=331992 RepID=UPI0003628666|nr:PEP-CTERM sorting domain-containing protein [Oscillatoria sp. PCC 10802]